MSSKNLPQKIQVKIKATHIGFINDNYLLYTEDAVLKGAKSWVEPYNKPVLKNHDKTTDPLGRVTGWKIVTSDSKKEPPKYLELTCTINDDGAIAKVLDGRYFTVSVGSQSTKIMCSECKQVINEEGLCEHKRGTFNEKGEPIHWIIHSIDYIEKSFVNQPADKFTGITHIDVGTGFIPYKNFLDNRESILSEIQTEDSYMKVEDAKLSTAQRNKLSESSFCGPNRSFPAHDKAHVEAGLKLLGRAKVSDETKSKIRACLYRKGKRFGITPTEDELQANPDLLTCRISDNFTEEEITTVNDWFKENPDSDLPEVTTPPQENADSADDKGDVSKLEKDELLTKYNTLKDEFAKQKKVWENKEKEFKDQLDGKDTILTQREEEINKLIDDSAKLEKRFRDSIISNISDLKKIKGDDVAELDKKFATRKIDSLVDTLADLRTDLTTEGSESKVQDPTRGVNNSDKKQNTDEKNYDIFSQDNSRMLEAE